jgi:hypothetical protein
MEKKAPIMPLKRAFLPVSLRSKWVEFHLPAGEIR